MMVLNHTVGLAAGILIKWYNTIIMYRENPITCRKERWFCFIQTNITVITKYVHCVPNSINSQTNRINHVCTQLFVNCQYRLFIIGIFNTQFPVLALLFKNYFSQENILQAQYNLQKNKINDDLKEGINTSYPIYIRIYIILLIFVLQCAVLRTNIGYLIVMSLFIKWWFILNVSLVNDEIGRQAARALLCAFKLVKTSSIHLQL